MAHGKSRFVDVASCRVLHADGTRDVPEPAKDSFRLGGVFHVRCIDKDGNLRWEDYAENLVTNTALNDVLNEYIRATSQTTAWYMGLVDNASFSTFAAGDTAALHSGWIESQDYSNGTRPQWSPGAASSQTITNSSTVNFSINANGKTIHGLFITSNNTIGGSSGLLFSEAAFSGGNQSVNNGDTLQCTYSLSAASN
jgi:hypothetical protein